MAKTGRRSKYTPEIVKKITDAIGLGATYKLATQYAGITFETFCQWRRSKPEFSDAINAAEGRGAIGWLAKIEKAANDGIWTAAAWKLERRYPHDYGKTVQEQQLTGKDGADLVGSILDRLPAASRAAVIRLATESDDPGTTGGATG